MTPHFAPNYTVLALLVANKFVLPELLAICALLRLILGQGWVRWTAAAALALALTIVAVVLAPALGMAQGSVYGIAARALQGGGALVTLAPAVLLLAGASSRRRRWPWIEVVVALLVAAHLALWGVTRF